MNSKERRGKSEEERGKSGQLSKEEIGDGRSLERMGWDGKEYLDDD